MSVPAEESGRVRGLGMRVIRWWLPYCVGGLTLGWLIALVPAFRCREPGFPVRWLLPLAGAAAGLAAGVLWALAIATERLTNTLVHTLLGRAPSASGVGGLRAAVAGSLGRGLRRRTAGPIRLFKMAAALLMGLVAAASTLTVLLAP